MIEGKNVLAIVPARGGSKGIPLKNLRLVLGVPMVARVGHMMADLPMIDRAVVSTDNEEIAKVAEEAGLAAPFRRPESLSGDRIGDWDVLNHALLETERLDSRRYDIVVMLQPTSPMRRIEDVVNTIQMLENEGWDSVWTVSATDNKHHPIKQLIVNEDGAMDYYDQQGATIVARQELIPVYSRNGVAYAITRDCLLTQKKIKGARAGALVVPGYHVSIDVELDIEMMEFIMRREGRR